MNQQYATYQQVDTRVRINTFIQSVYLWMCGALVITGVVAYIVGTNFELLKLFFNLKTGNPSILWWGCFIGSLGIVFIFGTRLHRVSVGMATAIFIIFSVLFGAMLSSIFVAYAHSSIASVFFICAATFAVTSFFGFVTKRDLTGVFHFMFMGLIGIIIASVVNIFVLKSPMVDLVIAYVGVIVFVGLTAYDTQKMKNMALSMPEDATKSMIRKGALSNALSLYLDFINLFLMLLRILGNRS